MIDTKKQKKKQQRQSVGDGMGQAVIEADTGVPGPVSQAEGSALANARWCGPGSAAIPATAAKGQPAPGDVLISAIDPAALLTQGRVR